MTLIIMKITSSVLVGHSWTSMMRKIIYKTPMEVTHKMKDLGAMALKLGVT